jgi:hypothetical protein
MQTGNTMFSPAVHVVLCQNCGAPIDAAIQGGMLPCRYCGAQNLVCARNEALVTEPRGAPIPEYERLARLRAQDGRPLLPPQSLLALMPDGDIPAWKIQEALAVWQSTRRELQATNNFEAAERLLFLSMALSNKFSEQNDLARQRAMFESALDVFTLPRHRQIMRCCLARSAAKLGDLQGAEAWLRPCDPASDDLESDSEFRFARALIDTFTGNYQRVLQALGQTPDAFPIQDAMDDVCAVFRANAWEKLGQVPTAVNLLRDRMSKGPHERVVLAKIMQVYGRWGVCAMSFPQADSAHSTVAAGQAALMSGGMLSMILLPMGILFVLMALGCLAAIVVAIVYESYDWIIGPAICAVVMGPMGLGFVFGGLKARASGKQAERLRLHGVRATGRVQSLSPTGMSINDVPQVMVQLVVELPGQMPYQATSKLLLSNPAMLMPGAQVALRVDPQNPNNVLLEAD